MPTTADLLYLAVFALVWPLTDYYVFWPRFLAHVQREPNAARRRLWSSAIVEQWLLTGAGMVLWRCQDRAWESLGLGLPNNWRLGVALVLIALLAFSYYRTAAKVARSPKAQASVRGKLGDLEPILPHLQGDLPWFVALSLTAGFCEEFLFRGYFVTVLAPWLSWWGAAVVSVPIFGLLHAYQGKAGIVRTAMIGLAFTLIVAAFASLWPAIILHAIIDIGSGSVCWLALRSAPPVEPLGSLDDSSKGNAP